MPERRYRCWRLRGERLECRRVLAAVSFTGVEYKQSFDSLPASGSSVTWANDATLPAWSLFNGQGTAITAITAGNGSGTTGTFYSFGTTDDRALGALASGGAYFGSPSTGGVAGRIAVAIVNDTGVSQPAFRFTYDGEQWRDGGNTAGQSLVVEYGYGGTFAAVSTWTAPGFSFTSPRATATASALDGNAPANRVAAIGGTVTPPAAWQPGTTLWIRWTDLNDAGNDHGLAIDNFSFSLPTGGGAISGTATTAAFITTYGTPSAAQSFPVAGTGLTGPITATAPSGYEVSADGAAFGPTATFAESAGEAAGTVHLRLAARAPVTGALNDVSVVLSSPGVDSVRITTPAAGNVVAPLTVAVTGAVAENKPFDGTTAAAIAGGTLVGTLAGDDVALSGGGTFASPDPGTDIPVTANLVLVGAAAANYALTQPTGLTATITPAVTPQVLLFEDFAGLTAGGNTATSGAGAPSGTELSGGVTVNIPASSKAYSAGGAVKLGTSSLAGSITTRTLDLSGNGGAFTVRFDVKGWTAVEGDILVTVSGQPARRVSYSATVGQAFETKTLLFTGGQANSTITFATSAKRAFLDNISITTLPVSQEHTIAGLVWDDANGDGERGQGEPGLAGWTVYLDLDNDGQPGGGEPATTTAADGSYAFTGLAAGTYTVAQVVPEGWGQTSPAAQGAAARAAVMVDPGYAPAERQHQKRFIPNDPLFGQQWHLRNTLQSGGVSGEDARLVTAWDTARGNGVVIAIVDDGLQHTHPDLTARYAPSLSYDFNGNDPDPTPTSADGHGTSAAGVAAASGDNGLGVTGAAPAATLAGIRLIAAGTTDQQEAAALSYKSQDIDIYSNSWGPVDDAARLEAPGPLTLAALRNGVETGRGGLGSIYVWAAGNGLGSNDNVNYDGYANSRYTIAVSAIDNRGIQSSYSEPGAPILVAAHSSGNGVGITTTDITGSGGYNTASSASGGDYTSDFGGTSSATPLVAGVVALMLEANPGLTWRDVQHVLVNSARRNHAADADWQTNGAGRWVNHKYGFGAVDAAAAVSLASTWTTVGPEVSAASPTITVSAALPDNNASGITSTYTVGAEIAAEWVEVVFDATHPYRGDLEVILTSPSGTQSVLATRHNDSGADYRGWMFTSARHWGESATGTWSLTVADRAAADLGTWNSWSLKVYGTSGSGDGGGGGGGGGGGTNPAGTQLVTLSGGLDATGIDFGNRRLTSALPIVAATGSLAAMTTVAGTASAAGTIAVTGVNLTADVTATVPKGFEVSSDGTTFATSVTLARDGDSVSGTLYVRLAASAEVGTLADAVVTLASSGAVSATVPIPASTVTSPAVQVTGLFVRGSTWANSYLDLDVFTTESGARLGWGLRDGANQLATSGTGAAQVTWTNVNRISVRFNQPIATPALDALKLIKGSSGGESGGDVTFTPTAVTMLAGNTVAQFSFAAALETGQYVVAIAAGGIFDAAGTTVLDGEWTNGTSTFAAGSGDGVEGGSFDYRFNVVAGDANANGAITGTDRATVAAQLFKVISSTNYRANLDGSASINGSDALIVSGRLFRAMGALPNTPVTTAPAVTAPTVAAVTATTAELGGRVASSGGNSVTERGIALLAGASGSPVIGGPGVIELLAAGTLGTFSVTAENLTPSTTYRFRAFARNALGISYSEIRTFTTAGGG